MSYAVAEIEATARPTAVIAQETSWEAFPALWVTLLDEVWATVRSIDGIVPNRNVMLYKDSTPNVEVGVEVAAPFPGAGRVIPSTLPEGRAVTTTHRGGYQDLGSAHEAIIEWCARHRLERAGPRWEIYGHWREDAAEPEVELYHLLR